MPRNVTVTLSDGSRHVFQNVPDNVTPEQVEQRAARQFPGRRVAAIDGGKKVGRAEAMWAGAKAGVENVANVFTGAVGSLVDKFGITPAQATSWVAENLGGYSPAEAAKIARNLQTLPGFSDIVKAGAQKRSERFAPVRLERPNYFATGKVLGETAVTAPFISAGAGKVAQLTEKAPLPALQKLGDVISSVARATQSGGIGVKASTKAARMALRVAGGATSGAATAAMTDQDIADAALAGAAVPVIGNMAKHGIGWTYDLLARRLGKTRAAEIMRNLIADKGAEIADALKNAPENIRMNTAQWLAKQGLLTPELAAATKIVGASKASKPLEQVAGARGEMLAEGRDILRGGATQTAGMGSVAAGRKAVSASTAPLREEALGAADVGRTQIVPLERQAAGLRQRVASEVDRARRFLGLADEQGMVLGQMDDLGDVFNPAAINRQRGIIGGLEQRGGEAATQSLQLGAAARQAEEVAANLRAQGLQPLDISGVVNRLRTEAAQAQYVNPPRFKLLSEFANNLENRAAQFGGVIDATGLYELRKNMGSVVADILGPTEPNALRKYTAQLIGETQPLIDDAIEAAGGKGWREYLSTFATGMRNVERQAFERELSKLPEAKFAEVMAGQKPEMVEKFFGPGRYDINVEMMGPKLPTAHGLASDIQAGLDVKNFGLSGLSPSETPYLSAGARERVLGAMGPGMKNVLARGMARIAGGVPGVYGLGVGAANVEQQYANRMYESVLRNLAPALAQPTEAVRLLQMQPTADTLGRISAGISPQVRNVLAQLAQGYMSGAPMAAPPVLANGSPLVGYGEVDGQVYPQYGYVE